MLLREAIGERTREAMRHLKAQGVFRGRAPYGYRFRASRDVTGRSQLELHAEEQAVIGRIVEMHKKGMKQKGIVATLRADTASSAARPASCATSSWKASSERRLSRAAPSVGWMPEQGVTVTSFARVPHNLRYAPERFSSSYASSRAIACSKPLISE